jgi:hypothetical protein
MKTTYTFEELQQAYIDGKINLDTQFKLEVQNASN